MHLSSVLVERGDRFSSSIGCGTGEPQTQCKIWPHKNTPLGLRSIFVCLFARHSLTRSCPELHKRISDDNTMLERNLLNYSLGPTLGSCLAGQLCFRAGFILVPFGTICKYTSGPSSYTCLLQGPWYLHSLPLSIPDSHPWKTVP